MLAGFPEGFFEFGCLAVGDVEHSLRFPDGTAAHLVDALREDDGIACLVAEFHHFIYERVLDRGTLGESHRLVDA